MNLFFMTAEGKLSHDNPHLKRCSLSLACSSKMTITNFLICLHKKKKGPFFFFFPWELYAGMKTKVNVLTI